MQHCPCDGITNTPIWMKYTQVFGDVPARTAARGKRARSPALHPDASSQLAGKGPRLCARSSGSAIPMRGKKTCSNTLVTLKRGAEEQSTTKSSAEQRRCLP